MTVTTFFAHSVVLVLLAAISPVLFLNASRVVESAGPKAGGYFAAGAASCLLALGVPAMGLMGAATCSAATAVGRASGAVRRPSACRPPRAGPSSSPSPSPATTRSSRM